MNTWRYAWPVLVAALLLARPAAAAQEPGAGSRALAFEDCVGIALQRSPLIAASALSVSVERLGESDARSGYLPDFAFRVQYYVRQPRDADRRYSLSFAVDPYNPVVAHLSLRARKLLTRLAVLSHEEAISECLFHVGEGLLDLAAFSQLETISRDRLAATRAQARSASSLYAAGALNERGVKRTEELLRIAELEQEKVLAAQDIVRDKLAALLDLTDAERQRLAPSRSFLEPVAGERPSWEEVAARSRELEMQAIRLQLQEMQITAARAAYIPDLLVGLQTPDPLSGTGDDQFYFWAGVRIPVWDGAKRARNVRRQRILLEQKRLNRGLEAAEVKGRWRAAEQQSRTAEVEWRRALLAAERARASALQAGVVAATAEEATRDQQALLEASGTAVLRELAYDKARLRLEFLSGALMNRYCASEVKEDE